MSEYDKGMLEHGLDVLESLKLEFEKGLDGGYVAGFYIREKLELLEYVASMADRVNG